MASVSFSIVIPAWSISQNLGRAIERIEPQMEWGDEIIIVGDFSNDETFAVAQGLATRFENINVVGVEANSGRLKARKVGIQNASGTHVLFLEADGELAEDALSVLGLELSKRKIDILHFGLEFVDHSCDESGSRKKEKERPHAPFDGYLAGDSIFKSCFVEGEYAWDLVGKCFDLQLCKRTFSLISVDEVQCSDDAVAFFALAYFAKKYYGLNGGLLCRLPFGGGQDSPQRISIDEYRECLKARAAYDAIEAFLDSVSHDDFHSEGALRVGLKLASDCAFRCKSCFAPSERHFAIKLLMEEWGPTLSVSALREQYLDDEFPLFRGVSAFDLVDKRPDCRFIATYYRQISGGGVERVLCNAIKIWKGLGYRVLLFLDKEADSLALKEIGVDECCVLPSIGRTSRSAFEREEAICRALNFYDVDRVVYHGWIDKALPWDMMTFKAHGVAFCIHCHGIFSHYAFSADPYFAVMPYVYAHADAIVSLNETDASFWRIFNDNVHVTINPPTFSTASFSPVDLLSSEKRILWLARVVPEKHPEAILDAFKIVANAVPDAVLTMVGSASDQLYEDKINKLVESSPARARIEKVAWTEDQASFYSKARVFVMTSEAKEGYPLTLVESKTFGLPCVMFELPYLTLAQDGRGIRTVPFGDVDGLANELIKILSDDELCCSMGGAARESAEELAEFDFSKFWQTVLGSLKGRESLRLIPPLMWETYLAAYSQGVNRKNADLRWSKGEILRLNKEISQCRDEISGLNKKIIQFKEANSWKIGRAITLLPRKIKKTVSSAKSFTREGR